MSQAKWFLWGAVILGLVIAIYIVLCPTDCH
jgi:hypothetical protein